MVSVMERGTRARAWSASIEDKGAKGGARRDASKEAKRKSESEGRGAVRRAYIVAIVCV